MINQPCLHPERKYPDMRKHLILLPALLFMALSSVHSQESNLRIASMSGDSVDCGVYLSGYREFLKLNYYDNAMEPWKKAFDNCPSSSLRLYVDGVTMYRSFIENAPEGPVREGLIDTLLLIYDRRMEYFGDEGNVLGRKGNDLLAYRGEDIEQVQQAYEMLGRSIEIEGTESREPTLLLFLTAGTALSRADRLEDQKVIEDYLMLSGIVDELAGTRSRWKKTQEKMDEIMLGEGLLDCGVLDTYYSSRLEEYKNDEAFLEKAMVLYQRTGCKRSDSYVAVSENLYRLDPDPVLAHTLGILYISREENEKAAGYLAEAVRGADLETETRAFWYYELALVTYALEDPCLAIEYAREAISLDEDLGSAYLLLGDAFIASRGSLGDDFQQRAAYWAAADQYRNAIRLDPSSVEEAREKLNSSLGQFPNQEDVFFQDLEEGDSYLVGGCINENTTVRIGP